MSITAMQRHFLKFLLLSVDNNKEGQGMVAGFFCWCIKVFFGRAKCYLCIGLPSGPLANVSLLTEQRIAGYKVCTRYTRFLDTPAWKVISWALWLKPRCRILRRCLTLVRRFCTHRVVERVGENTKIGCKDQICYGVLCRRWPYEGGSSSFRGERVLFFWQGIYTRGWLLTCRYSHARAVWCEGRNDDNGFVCIYRVVQPVDHAQVERTEWGRINCRSNK